MYCGQPLDITKDEWVKPNTTRYAHKKCYEEKRKPGEDLLPDDIYYYLKDEVHLAIDYRTFESQRSNMIKKNGYTNAGILQALKYWYQVKKSSPDKANGGIGIVPYIYQDAQNYYKNLAKQQKEISKSTSNQITTTKTRTELKCKINPRGSSTVYNEIHTVKEDEKTGEKTTSVDITNYDIEGCNFDDEKVDEYTYSNIEEKTPKHESIYYVDAEGTKHYLHEEAPIST